MNKKKSLDKENKKDKISIKISNANISKYKSSTKSIRIGFYMPNNAIKNDENKILKCINKNRYSNINLHLRKNFLILIWKFIFINFINIIFTQHIVNNTIHQNSISLKVLESGNKKIFAQGKRPDSCYINGEKTNIDSNGRVLIKQNQMENIVKLVWNDKLNNCQFLFSKLTNIIEIDLSEFDASEVTSMYGMFYYCSDLEYINFGNINTSSLTDMSYMFYNCFSLYELDLSNFDTSKVSDMTFLFTNCYELQSINLTNWNTSKVRYMNSMFLYLKSLKELDISHLDTSNVIDMSYFLAVSISLRYIDLSKLNTSKVQAMEFFFYGCLNLESVNLSNINASSVKDMSYMFYDCLSLISLDLSNIKASKVEKMDYMFVYSNSLTSINFTGFDTTDVYDMTAMFFGCSSLVSLDLTSFNFNQAIMTSMFEECSSLISIEFSKDYISVDKVAYMFKECSSLVSIDLYNFDFILIENMEELFYGCSSLTSLDLSYIDTFSVENIDSMFFGCNSLKSLDFGGWITSSVKRMNSLFYDCTSLISLDLSNFETSSIENMTDLFYNCIKLTSINLENFKTSSVTNMESMFYGCISLLSLNLSSFDTSSVTNMKSMFFRCEKLTSLDISNFNTENVTNMVSMFYGCSSLEYINFYNYNDDSLDYIDYIFHKISNNLIICINNSSKALSKIKINSELSKLKCSINDCNSNWKKNKKRMIYNNGSCLDNCKNDKIYKYEYKYICYKECPKGTHSSKSDKYICEKDNYKCLNQYPFIILKNNTCSQYCNSEDFFNGICELNEFNIENKGIFISNILKEIEKGYMDKFISKIINDKKDLVIKKNTTIYQITSSFNQNNLLYKNLSVIKLGECEKVLKENYKISSNEALIIFKIEQKEEGFLIPLIEYEIFNPKTKKSLDLNICKDSKINIYIPVSINESLLYKYNPNSNYYNDICNTTTSEFGTDLTLYDRKNEYNNNHYSICSNNCKYINYNSENKTVVCECKVQKGINFDNSKLLNNLKSNKRKIYLEEMKCFKLIFSNELFKSITNYLIILIIIIFIISFIYFYTKENKLLCNQIEELLNLKKLLENEKYKNKYYENSSELITSSKKSSINKLDISNLGNFQIKLSSESNISKDINSKNEIIDTQILTEKYEINNIPFEIALENDKRNYFHLYISLLKANYILLFAFFRKKDYNLYSIKICMFFFLFASNMFINALFFNDTTMHKIYEDKGIFNFIYVFPKIIYSSFIGSIFIIFMKNIYLSQQNILSIKYEKNIYKSNAKITDIMKCLNIKCICFFAINFLFLLFFWYYLTCFSILYKNSQIYLFKIIIISFSFFLIWPFILYLLVALLRITALKWPGKCLYKFSQIIQFF